MSDPLVEKALDDLDNDYGGDMAEYLGPEWRDILRSHIQTAVDSATERLRGLLARLEWAGLTYEDTPACPVCGVPEFTPHEPACQWVAVMHR